MNTFVNRFQSPEVRRDKYLQARQAGLTSAWARRLRDFTAAKFRQRLNLILKGKEVSDGETDRDFGRSPGFG